MNLKTILFNIYIRNILIAILVLILLVIFIFLWLNVYTNHGKTVTVPNVKGVTVEQAIPSLKSKGLRYEVVDSIYMKNQKPGVICEQLPQAESTVKLNRTIYLTINSFSSRQIELPDVRDLSQRQAEGMLEKAGFTVSVELVESEFKDLVLRVKKGNTVVYPGTKFIDGTKLTLEVGNGALGNLSDSIPPISVDDSIPDESWF
ncbi:MAG: PASTA domain-containing protein [Candidatus Azobacteroides sp.]|nr:PASTA domain-containing protein [Candidatus Azobacteroides sp.]